MDINNYIDIPGQAIYLMEYHKIKPDIFYQEIGFIISTAGKVQAERLFMYLNGSTGITVSVVKNGESVLFKSELQCDHFKRYFIRATEQVEIEGLTPMKTESTLEDLINTQVVLYQSIVRRSKNIF